MTPLVNGVKSCSIYSQRLSPITVVEKKSYSMNTLCFITTQKALSTTGTPCFFFHFSRTLVRVSNSLIATTISVALRVARQIFSQA